MSLFLADTATVEHGGYYGARESGIFQAAGLSVKIEQKPADVSLAAALNRGEADFGVMDADQVVLGRAAGIPLVAILAPIRDNPRCVIVHRESSVTDLSQLGSLKVIAAPNDTHYQYMKRKYKLADSVTVAREGGLGHFLVNLDYAILGNTTCEPYVVGQTGKIECRSLVFSDFGFNPYSATLVTTELTIRERPELVKTMVECVQKGWYAYLENSVETNREIAEDNHAVSVKALDYGAGVLKSGIVIDVQKIRSFGGMDPVRWYTLHQQLLEVGLVDDVTWALDQMVTNQFIDVR